MRRIKILYPKLRYQNIQSIDFNELLKYNLKGIVLDIDNTLIDYTLVLEENVKKWVAEAKEKGFKVCILTNTNNLKKAVNVANELDLPYIRSAKKPFRKGFIRALQLLNLKAEDVAMIGDQLFTDVLGANIMDMVSIYVDPINKKEYWYTKWKRPIESIILKMSQKERKI